MSLCLFIARNTHQLFSIGPPARLQGLHQRGNPTVIVVEGYFPADLARLDILVGGKQLCIHPDFLWTHWGERV